MLQRSLFSAGIFLVCSILSAKTPQQLKAEMDAVLPAGMKTRMAWVDANGSAYVYDSDENMIRDLTPTSVFSGRKMSRAYISQDGEYVVLKDQNSDAIQTVKFDGTGKQTLFNQGTLICTWKDPQDNKQCFVASALPNKTGTWAIGINDQSKQLQVAAGTFPKTTSQWGFGCGISVDGKMMGGFDSDRPGLWPLPSGAFIPAGYSPLNPPGVCQGCNFAIRPTTGGVYEYGHFHEDHREICVHTANGTYKEALYMSCNASSSIIAAESHELCWTNHLNYVTAMLAAGPSPALFDVVQHKCVALKDNCDPSTLLCEGDWLNAVILPKGTASREASVIPRISHVPSVPRRLYSITGRLLSAGQTGMATAAVRSLRIPVGNQATAIIVGRL